MFRTFPSDAASSKALYEEVARIQKRVGIISEETDYAQGFLKAFEEANVENDLSIVKESYLPGQRDFHSLLLKLRKAGTDSLFINSQTEAGFLAVLKQLKELRWNVKTYGAYWPGTSVVLADQDADVEGITFVDTPSAADALEEGGFKLYQEFVSKYGPPKTMDMLIATTIEGFRALNEAIQSGEEVKSFLSNAKFNGLFGPWSFDRNGDIEGVKFVIKRIQNRKPELVRH